VSILSRSKSLSQISGADQGETARGEERPKEFGKPRAVLTEENQETLRRGQGTFRL
jgi:hypothetical protein